MECPHVSQYSHKFPSHFDPFICSACKTGESPWLCLDCGRVNCGRYIKGHAKAHYEEFKHSISIDCCSFSAYCYTCDSFVTNHVIHPKVFDVLNSRHGTNGSNYDDEDSDSENNDRASDITSSSSNSTSSLVSNQEEEEEEESNSSSKTSSLPAAGRLIRRRGRKRKNGRKTKFTPTKQKNQHLTNGSLGGKQPGSTSSGSGGGGGSGGRKRKRDNSEGSDLSSDISSDCPSLEKKAKVTRRNNRGGGGGRRRQSSNNNRQVVKNSLKHGIVGLRNLGNTCFMNSVLQSLSKIQDFCCYFCTQIPSQDHLKLNNNNTTTPYQPNGKFPYVRRFPYSTRSRKNGLLSSNNVQNGGGGSGSDYNSSQLKNKNNCENGLIESRRGSAENSSLEMKLELRAEEFLTEELRKILVSLSTKGNSAVSPDTLFHIIWEVMPRFRGYQQDAHEFLRYMLDRLHNELVFLLPKFGGKNGNGGGGMNGFNGHPFRSLAGVSSRKDPLLTSTLFKGRPSIVTSIFGGVLQNEVRCCSCGMESKKHDPFLDLSLDLPNNEEPRLEDCLSRFIDVEELTDADMYFCSNCKTKQKSTKRFWIRRLPNVLCLHLKRFRWSNCLRTKLDNYVHFPLNSLDMSRYLWKGKVHETRGSSSLGSALYDLSAVIVHHGSGIGSGHYTSMGQYDGEWYHFNDNQVKPISSEDVGKCKAYILFYKRKGLGELKN